MTECCQTSLEFPSVKRRKVEADFSSGAITSNAGIPLLSQVDQLVKAHDKPPRRLILDFDATDTPLHGDQEGRFFHGYYDDYCFLPLYVFCGRHLLVSYLRSRQHGEPHQRPAA